MATAGVTALSTKAGLIPIRRAAQGSSASLAIPHDVRVHARRAASLEASVTDRLSSFADIKARELAAPVISIVKGVSFLLVELPSLEALGRVAQTDVHLPAEQLLD